MRKIKLFLSLLMVMIVSVGNVWATSVTWPGTSALPGTATSIASDANVTIMTSATNTYTNPIRVYANNTITIAVASGYTIESVTYEASSTGNYVTYAQEATVSPSVTPAVSGKNVTWSFSSTTTTFTFKPSSQTRSNGITVVYSSTGGDEPGGGDDPEPGEETAGTGTIEFGTSKVKIDAASDSGDDDLGNTWTITTVGTTSFTQNAAYSQVGSGNNPATSITFTTTLSQEMKVSAFSAKFGGFNGTAGTVTLKVGDTTVGTGSLNAGTDVIVNASNKTTTGTVLTVTVTGISKGVKAYYISYTLEEPGAPAGLDAPVISATGDDYDKTVTISATAGATIRYTLDGNEPTSTSTEYTTPFAISSTTTVKAIAIKDEQTSSVASQEYTLAPAYTTIAELQEHTPSSGSIPVRFTFDNVKVTFVSGKNAYINDGTNGMIIFSEGHGLEVGNILNGEIKTTLTKFQGSSELTTFTKGSLVSGTEEVTPIEKAISAITLANVGMIVDLGQLTYSNSSFSDGNNTIAYYDKFSTGLALTNGTYNVKGIVIRYNNTIQIAPRTVDDIVAPIAKENANTQWVESSKVVRIGDATTNWWSTSSNGAKTFGSSNPSVATISNEGVITLVAPGQTNLTFSTAETGTYYAGNASLTLTVKAALPAGASEFTWVAAEMGVENGTAVTTATGNEDPISIVFAQGDGSNAPKYYTSGSAVRSYVQNTITISSATEGKLIYGVEIVFANATNNKLSGEDLTVEGTSGTWSGLAQEVVFDVPNASGNQAHLVSINVIYANGTVTELEIANVAMKTTDNPLTIVPTKHNPNSAPILYTIATEDQQYATIEDGVITPHKVTVTPINVTASIAAGTNYTAASTTFTITVSEKQVPALEFPEASYNANLGSAFAKPTLTNPEDVAVVYSSSVPGVATVSNEEGHEGEIELVGEGTTTITAAFAGNGDYAANSASYTLNVADPNKDVLTAAGIGKTSYENWSDKTFTSGVKYAGNNTTGTGTYAGTIQMRVQNPSGIVSTSTIGYLKSISATATKNGANSLNIYAKNTAYESSADLYDNDKRGTLIGTISNEGGVMVFEEGKAYSDHYKYIGIKANGGAVYYDDIIIKWEPAVFTTYSVTYKAGDATGDDVVIDDIEDGTIIQLQDNSYSYAGHIFTGWSDGENIYQAGDDYTVNGNVTFTAQWAEQFNVTYNPGEAGGDAIVRTVAAGAYNLEAGSIFTYAGHAFDGWLKDETKYNAGASYPISENVAFTAQWVEAPDPVTVTFVAGTDKSETMSLIKNGISLSYEASSGTFNRDDDYRCYSGKTLTIASEVGNITNIEFTLTQNTFTTETGTYENGSWNGSAESIVFTTSGGQVRMTQISVTYIPNGNTPKQPAGLSYDQTSYTIAQNEGFTAPTLNNPNDLIVTYSGNNDDVATVNAATGAITLGEATGVVTITATAETQGNYLAGTASYTLTVNAPIVIDDLTGTWELVTDASQLVAGKKVIIASVPDEGAAVTMSTTQTTNNRSGVAGATVAANVISAQNGTAVFTIEAGTEENTIAFKSSANEYLYAASSDKNYIRSQGTNDANGSWLVTISEGVATITAQGENTHNVMRYNPNTAGDNPLFACYASSSTTGTLITLYMLHEDTPEPPTPDYGSYERDGLTPGNYATICLPKAGTISGATLFEIASFENGMIYMDEVGSTMEAGKPYIFQATSEQLNVTYTSSAVEETAGNANGLHGFYDLENENATLPLADDATLGNYILYQNAYWLVSGRAATIANFRAYIKIGEINYVAPAPGRRRVGMSVHGEQVATGMENVQGDNVQCTKVLIDGQLFILRGEKMYDVKGQLVK